MKNGMALNDVCFFQRGFQVLWLVPVSAGGDLGWTSGFGKAALPLECCSLAGFSSETWTVYQKHPSP